MTKDFESYNNMHFLLIFIMNIIFVCYCYLQVPELCFVFTFVWHTKSHSSQKSKCFRLVLEKWKVICSVAILCFVFLCTVRDWLEPGGFNVMSWVSMLANLIYFQSEPNKWLQLCLHINNEECKHGASVLSFLTYAGVCWSQLTPVWPDQNLKIQTSVFGDNIITFVFNYF
jgi:hypothetical protein